MSFDLNRALARDIDAREGYDRRELQPLKPMRKAQRDLSALPRAAWKDGHYTCPNCQLVQPARLRINYVTRCRECQGEVVVRYWPEEKP